MPFMTTYVNQMLQIHVRWHLGGHKTTCLISGLTEQNTRQAPPAILQTKTGGRSYHNDLPPKLMNPHCSFYTNYVSSSSDLRYGDRCRASSKLKALFRTQKDHQLNSPWKAKMNLKPNNLLTRNANARFLRMISGGKISTPMDSSKKELLDELLDIIHEMSNIHWQDDLDLSMTSCTTSSATEDSSDSDYEKIEEAPLRGPPPKEAPDRPPPKYCPF
ncbi:ORF3 [Torque teno felis virus-Fc-TTV1]|uniref:ORF3 n=1 Tax=Torque teno felis virus-Fc-TTV1 TaxID=1138485 RepID=A0A678N484_9VIRU|nr:ORF3 [Torque teno felis virus-Fc-TTV1]AEZ53062.1 ORF3 [Torque teno felis virus-Fc-TTV1]